MPAVQETQVQFLGQEDPLEKEMATHSSILAWRIPWTRNLAGYSPWGRTESDTAELLQVYFEAFLNLGNTLRGPMIFGAQ